MSTSILLIINSGSSSVKFQVFAHQQELNLLASGKIFNLGSSPSFSMVNHTVSTTNPIQSLAKDCTHEQAIHLILKWISQQEQNWKISAVAHRVVHGGELFTKSVFISKDILGQLKKLIPLAPLHQPHNIAAIEILKQAQPDLPQIACFDTAFHAGHTPLFTTYALPEYLRVKGIRRFGFHGLSFEWIAYQLKREHTQLAQGRIIAAHLGNGASLCAMKNGLSIDTTMGLTALDGLPMGTRSGSLDPGAIIYMLRDLGLSAQVIEHILYNESGLFGLSGISNDVKELQNNELPAAQFALDYFSLKTAQFIGMMTIALGGVDGIIFTGGIGENSEVMRRKILKQVDCLKPFSTLVIPANEEKMMAMHTLALLNNFPHFPFSPDMGRRCP